jgi:hypothetical protein
MMWHERQNVVVFEFSMCAENPTALHNSGKRNRPTKARIFPSRVVVTEGRTKKKAAKPKPSKNMRSESVSGAIMDANKAPSVPLWASVFRAYPQAYFFAARDRIKATSPFTSSGFRVFA